MDDLKTYVQRAREHRACERALATIAACQSLDEAKEHEEAPFWACWYAWNVVQGRCPELEDVIAKNPSWASWYACQIIRGSWPEGEPAIRREPRTAYLYARWVIKGRWPEGERAIRRDPVVLADYRRYLKSKEEPYAPTNP